MRCPICGTSHPPMYEQCVSCGGSLFVEDENEMTDETRCDDPSELQEVDGEPQRVSPRKAQHRLDVSNRQVELELSHIKEPESKRRSRSIKFDLKSNVPSTYGVIGAFSVLLISAGATLFFLTRAPEQDQLLAKGIKELETGQYAFAVETLTKAHRQNKDNAKILLALARAYVGSDQVNEAWECILQAQQLGKGIAEEPELATNLSNYYRQRNQYQKAVSLLRPLAQQNIPGKKAELADLAALWGDSELRDGNLEKALMLWEEVQSLKEGSRYSEAEARLATIYKRLSEKLAGENKDKEALNYLAKLNNIADNPRNYEMASDLYARTGQLELAIDQLRKAARLEGSDPGLKRKLALLLNKRGKELLDQGELDTGYGYLQQAKSVDPTNNSVPTVTLKSVNIDVQGPRIFGQVYNPTEDSINSLTVKVDLVDTTGSERVLWTRDLHVVDEYVPPLGSKEGKRIDFNAGTRVRADGSCVFKVYFDGKLYNTYPIGKKQSKESHGSADDNLSTGKTPEKETVVDTPDAQSQRTKIETPAINGNGEQGEKKDSNAEEKTLKELEF